MKTIIFALLMIPLTLVAQAPDTLWTRAYGGNGDDEGIACVDAGNQSTIVTGWDESHGNGGHDVVIMKVTDAGERLWTRYYGRTSTDEGYSVVRVGENSFAVGGWSTVSGLSGEFYLIVFNGSGDTLWTKHFGGSGTQKCYDLVKTQKVDGFAMVGYSNSGGNDNVMLLRVSPEGDSLWSRFYGGPAGDVGWSIVETIDHGYLLAGYTNSYGHGDRDVYVIRTDAAGDTLWTRTFGGTQLDWAYYANSTRDAGYVIAGYTVSLRESGQYNAYFLKLNDQGGVVWSNIVRSTNGGTSVGTSICQMTNNHFFVAGHGEGSGGSGAPDAFAAELDASGEVIWSKIVGGWSSDYGREGIVKPDSAGFFIAGNTFTYGAGSSDVYEIFLSGEVPHELTVLAPNGGEAWTIGTTEIVRWYGVGFSGPVSVEINRAFPNGGWEYWGAYTNDGSEAFIVTGPPSTHCRIRVAAVDDTLTDISDADFSIVNAPPPDSLIVLSPNGGEVWQISMANNITWFGSGFSGNVRVEFNRSYPTGTWELLSSSTPNDGIQPYTLLGPPSQLCRVRVSALSETLSDISDSNFTLVGPAGYLALVRASAPGAPVYSWDAGSVECPGTSSEDFRLKNFGSATITVSRALDPATDAFSTATNCPATLLLAPLEMSQCALTLLFAPQANGVHRDTLLIPTDAANAVGGYVRIPLFGQQTTTPLEPVMTINMRNANARLRWRRVTQSTNGCLLNTQQYNVYIADAAAGPFTFHGATSDTFYVHTGIGNFSSRKFYRVTAVMP